MKKIRKIVNEIICACKGHEDNNWAFHCVRCDHITNGKKFMEEELRREWFDSDKSDILPHMIHKKSRGGQGKEATLRNQAVVVLHTTAPTHFNIYQLSRLFERDRKTISDIIRLYGGKYRKLSTSTTLN